MRSVITSDAPVRSEVMQTLTVAMARTDEVAFSGALSLASKIRVDAAGEGVLMDGKLSARIDGAYGSGPRTLSYGGAMPLPVLSSAPSGDTPSNGLYSDEASWGRREDMKALARRDPLNSDGSSVPMESQLTPVLLDARLSVAADDRGVFLRPDAMTISFPGVLEFTLPPEKTQRWMGMLYDEINTLVNRDVPPERHTDVRDVLSRASVAAKSRSDTAAKAAMFLDMWKAEGFLDSQDDKTYVLSVRTDRDAAVAFLRSLSADAMTDDRDAADFDALLEDRFKEIRGSVTVAKDDFSIRGFSLTLIDPSDSALGKADFATDAQGFAFVADAATDPRTDVEVRRVGESLSVSVDGKTVLLGSISSKAASIEILDAGKKIAAFDCVFHELTPLSVKASGSVKFYRTPVVIDFSNATFAATAEGDAFDAGLDATITYREKPFADVRYRTEQNPIEAFEPETPAEFDSLIETISSMSASFAPAIAQPQPPTSFDQVRLGGGAEYFVPIGGAASSEGLQRMGR